jgi:hypothetical protein
MSVGRRLAHQSAASIKLQTNFIEKNFNDIWLGQENSTLIQYVLSIVTEADSQRDRGTEHNIVVMETAALISARHRARSKCISMKYEGRGARLSDSIFVSPRQRY